MAAAGYLFANGCYQDAASVLQALYAQPIYAGASGSYQAITSASFDATAGVFNFTLHYSDFHGADVTFSGSFPAVLCDPAVPVGPYVPFDPVAAAGYWSWALAFVLGCYVTAKYAGMIVSAIRRW